VNTNAQLVINDLIGRGARVSLVEGDRILVAPPGLLSDEDRARIRAHKDDIISILKSPNAAQRERTTPDFAHGEGCWRCGAAPFPPDLDTQVEILRGAHRGRGEIFDWPDSHWTRLRTLLRDGDVIMVIKNIFQMLDPNYGAVYVERAGEIVKIDRRELMEG